MREFTQERSGVETKRIDAQVFKGSCERNARQETRICARRHMCCTHEFACMRRLFTAECTSARTHSPPTMPCVPTPP
eukprot:360787-Chlamydomonas_euryale.AAC.3